MRRSLALFLFVALALWAVAGVALAAFDQEYLIGKGQFGQRHWFVAAAQDGERRGICFEVGVFHGSPRGGVTGNGECSAPAVKRGIVLTADEPASDHRKTAITVVGLALNRAVREVEITSFDGRTVRLTPRALAHARAEGSTVGDFRYLSYAVRGPWCVERLVTLNAEGKPLWETEWEEITGYRKRGDPRDACPGF